MEVKIIRATPENVTKAYRAIYELMYENARVSSAKISRCRTDYLHLHINGIISFQGVYLKRFL
jgi:hypothetical protein